MASNLIQDEIETGDHDSNDAENLSSEIDTLTLKSGPVVQTVEPQKRRINVIRHIKKPDNIEDLSIIEIARKYPPPTWKNVFEYADDEIELASNILEDIESREGRSFPLRRDIFRAFEMCPRHQIKVAIFGMDPYPQILGDGSPRAQGLSFSVREDDQIPSSLQNIFKELKADLEIDNYSHGDLSSWARQGVLLVNYCLTVSPGKPGSHKRLWIGFMDKVIKDIAQANKDCIYVLWGNEAKKLAKMIEGNPLLLTAAHPSGLSASRGFLGCKHFSQINEELIRLGKMPIDWHIN